MCLVHCGLSLVHWQTILKHRRSVRRSATSVVITKNCLLLGSFVGADKLSGKYAMTGLLLGSPVLTGRYNGGSFLGLRDGSLLRDTVVSKLDGLFDPLLAVEPFKYNPLGDKTKSKKSLFGDKTGTALTAGGDVVSSKLQQKLDALSSGLGIAKQAPFQAMDITDNLVRTKENIIRGAIDGTESIIGKNLSRGQDSFLVFREQPSDSRYEELTLQSTDLSRLYGRRTQCTYVDVGADQQTCTQLQEVLQTYRTLHFTSKK